MAALTSTMLAAITPKAAATAVISVGLFCAHTANFCSTGKAFSRIGNSAAPTPSLASPRATPKRFIEPAAVLAESVAAPPKVTAISAITSSIDAPSLIIWRNSGDSFAKAVILPPYAFSIALVTVSRLMPLAAATSIASVAAFCASLTSIVALTSPAMAGLKSSSVMPFCLPAAVIKASTPLTCASVAPVVFCNWRSSIFCACSSSIAPLTASPRATVKPPSATAAYLFALPKAYFALACAPSKSLKPFSACFNPLGLKCVTIGR